MADFNFVESTGIIVADTTTTLETVEQEYRDVFGQDLLVDPTTPQGVLIAAETNSRQSVARNNAATANQFNPNRSGGIFLDAILALTGGERIASERSILTAQLTGVANSDIPIGSLAETTAGDQFETVEAVQLNASGMATVQFRSVEFGPIPAPAGSLTVISENVTGWETVNNTSAATLGMLVESDVQARRRRRGVLALQGSSIAEAITSAVRNVEGVRSFTFRENVESSTQTIDNVSLVAHSIFVCVEGGTNIDVATAILSRKPPGTNFNGNTTVNVTDPASRQVYPITFRRPDQIEILIRVTIGQNTAFSDPVQVVRDAIISYTNRELENEEGFGVGVTVSPTEIAGAINRRNPRIFVRDVEISLATPVNYVRTPIDMEIFQQASVVSSSITVNIA